MIEISNGIVYLQLQCEEVNIGEFIINGGVETFEANYNFPEYPLEAQELRDIADHLDKLNEAPK